MATMSQDLSLDDVYQLLSASRRREIIGALSDADDDATLTYGDLVDRIEATEDEGGEYTTPLRKRIQIDLYQSQLPKLDMEGVINYNSNAGTVSRGRHFDQVAEMKSRTESGSNGGTA